GARPRDFGYTPKGKEILSWYKTSIELCTLHILSGKPTSNYAKQMLANTIRDLWVKVKAYDAIEKSAIAIRSQQSWNEAWVSTIDILQFDTNKMTKDSIERLITLRDVLKPTDLE